MRLDASAAAGVTVDLLDAHRAAVTDVLGRARSVDWPRNPWAKCGGGSLADYLARPMAAVRTAAARCVAAGEAADAAGDERIPPFNADVPLRDQGRARAAWGERTAALLPAVRAAGLAGWAGRDAAAVRVAADRVVGASAALADVAEHPLDADLRAVAVATADAAPQLSAVRAYLAVAGTWSAAFAFSVKAEAKRVLATLGLPLERAVGGAGGGRYLTGRRSLERKPAGRALGGADRGRRGRGGVGRGSLLEVRTAAEWLDHLLELHALPAVPGLGPGVARGAGVPPRPRPGRRWRGSAPSPARAGAVVTDWRRQSWRRPACSGRPWLADVSAASSGGAGRRRGRCGRWPIGSTRWRGCCGCGTRGRPCRRRWGRRWIGLVTQGVEPLAAVAALDRAGVEVALGQRLRAHPELQRIDGRRIETQFEQYRLLAERRRDLVRDKVEHEWVSRQKTRFLAAAGTKLNGAGADLKRRLSTKGKNANRLRQVFAGDGGEALLDLCPVWMASPETVAQVFPRAPLFDVVIFDEASQCRLEEALPVLVRAKRAVIAGDPQQLPPTRFFESASCRARRSRPRRRPGAVRGAPGRGRGPAVGGAEPPVRQCYLDVHYRSRSGGPDRVQQRPLLRRPAACRSRRTRTAAGGGGRFAGWTASTTSGATGPRRTPWWRSCGTCWRGRSRRRSAWRA